MAPTPNPENSRIQRTSAGRSLVRTLARSNLRLLQQVWVRPIFAAILLSGIGLYLRSGVEAALKEDLQSDLHSILATDVTALKIWLRSQEQVASSAARDPEVLKHVMSLLETAAQAEGSRVRLVESPALVQLREELKPMIDGHEMTGFVVVDLNRRVIAARNEDLIGLVIDAPETNPALKQVFQGQTCVSIPHKSAILMPDKHGHMRVGVPTMFAISPIKTADGTVVAALGLRVSPEREFAQILEVARAGKTGETFAFDRNGLLLSQSVFEDQLRQIGLLTEDADSILNVSLRDPGLDLVQGGRAEKPRSEQPLTLMAKHATAGQSGSNFNGYRSYRGVETVGAWTWLEDYDFGVATEIESPEAFRVLVLIRWVFWALFALLVLASIVILLYSLRAERLQREARRAVVEARQLGQYSLDRKLGEGGMGVVFCGHHAMLHRPTAIKFLHLEKTTEQTIGRFEREVTLTSQLVHPNTISIYDYGRTPEGIFYYAMEYLDGLTLEQLVRQFGPQSESRTIHILRQICGSLSEAHGCGLIHRDIKPANIMLTYRGGIPDFVKVLDFGLVKAVDAEQQSGLTSSGSLTGTPLYLSPEAIRTPDEVDGRSDLYAIGAVGYYLLTGKPVFEGPNVIEIIRQHSDAVPVAPSARLGRPINPDLERVILRCLAKSPDDRPQNAEELENELQACGVAAWKKEEAARWWQTLQAPTNSDSVATTDWDAGATIVTRR